MTEFNDSTAFDDSLMMNTYIRRDVFINEMDTTTTGSTERNNRKKSFHQSITVRLKKRPYQMYSLKSWSSSQQLEKTTALLQKIQSN